MDLGQIFTNERVAEYMVSMFKLNKNAAILDPCFGNGAFLKACINQGFENVEGYEIDFKLFEATKKQFPLLNLYNKDFLSASKKKLYDGIIMNPPYIRQEKINDLKEVGITKEILRQNKIFCKLPSTANMYMYFIVKALDLLKLNGELVVIFPSSWIQARGGHQFQKTLLSNATIKKQIHISGEVFEKDALVEVVILKLEKGVTEVCNEIIYIENKNGKLIELNRNVIMEELQFVESFQKYATVRRGLTTGCNSMYINPNLNSVEAKSYLKPIISSPKSIVGYSTKEAKTDNIFCPINREIMPNEVKEYIDTWRKKIEDKKLPKTLYEKIKNEKNWYSLKPIDSQGILFSYFVRNDMKFIFNCSECMVRDNFYIIKPLINEWLLFALLNNYYTFYQLEIYGKKYGAGLLKLQRYDIEKIQFPDIDSFLEEDKEKLILLARELEKTGNEDWVGKITEIVAKYTEWNFLQITEKYFTIKKYRLEEKNNGY